MPDAHDASQSHEFAMARLEQLGSFPDQLPCAMALLDSQGEILRINEAMVNVIGAHFRDATGRRISEVDADMWRRLERVVGRVMSGERVSAKMVYEIASAPRSEVVNDELISSVLRQTRRYQYEYFPLRDDTEIVGVGVLAFAISERDELEAQSRDAAARYDVLRDAANACVRCTNADDLYEALVELVVSLREIDMAWVGIPDGGLIRKGPSRGIDDGYLHDLIVNAIPGDLHSQGPTGQAVLTGNAMALRDFQAAPSTEPWHAEAERVGFRSVAAFPLKCNGEVVAVLSVYSRTDEGLSDATIEMLNSLRPVLTLGLEHFQILRGNSISRDNLMMRDGALGTISQGIVIADATANDLPLIYVSPSFSLLTGYSSSDILGKNCRFLQGPDTNRETVNAIRHAIDASQGIEVEILNYTKSGRPFWNHLSMSPVFDEAGLLTRYVGVQSDISERRQLQSQLIQAQRLEAIGTLAGGIAHDFNNLLLVMQGYTSLLLRELHDERLHDVAQRIQNAVDRGAEFTRHLLAYSRQQVNSPRYEDLTALVRDVTTLVSGVMGANVTLMTDLDDALSTIYIDRSQFEQILINLVANASDAMADGGTLVVRTHGVSLDERTHTGEGEMPPGNYVVLEVTDTGAGMSKETIQRIFEPFYTTKAMGTGLGLASVIGIVKQNMGFISAYSEVGLGSTFKVYFPAASPTSKVDNRRRAALDEDRDVRGTETILVVEDDAEVRRLVVNALSELGYQVIEATSGATGLALARSYAGRIDVVVTDIIMPEMNGRELAEHLVVDRPELKVIFTSGYPSNVLHDRHFLDDHSVFIEKPYSSRVVARAIRSLLEES